MTAPKPRAPRVVDFLRRVERAGASLTRDCPDEWRCEFEAILAELEAERTRTLLATMTEATAQAAEDP